MPAGKNNKRKSNQMSIEDAFAKAKGIPKRPARENANEGAVMHLKLAIPPAPPQHKHKPKKNDYVSIPPMRSTTEERKSGLFEKGQRYYWDSSLHEKEGFNPNTLLQCFHY